MHIECNWQRGLPVDVRVDLNESRSRNGPLPTVYGFKADMLEASRCCDVYRRRYLPLSISLPFLAVGALPMITTWQPAIRGFLAAQQPRLILIRSGRYFLNPAVSYHALNPELLVFDSPTAADAVPRRG